MQAFLASTVWRVQKALHENDVEPAIVFSADLAKVRDALECGACVKRDGGLVFRIDRADQAVFAKSACFDDQGIEQCPPDSPSAVFGVNVNTVLHRVAIAGGPCPKIAE